MPDTFSWTKDVYEVSLSSRCWCFTPYSAGWDGWDGERPADDEELRQIVATEYELAPLPGWVASIVKGPMNWVGFCGHYLFPLSFLDAVDAIGNETPPLLNHTCYTVDRKRKRRMMDYASCLEAWRQGLDPKTAADELCKRSKSEVDWTVVCRDLWKVLGDHTELKKLLVERMLLRTRWWLRATVWDDDTGEDYCFEEDTREWREEDPLIADNGNPQFRRGGYDESASPRVQENEARLAEICPDWNWFRTVIVEFSWPCAPKAFRFIEKTLWCIGRERPVISLPSFPLEHPEFVPGFLQCEDTCPDRLAAGKWWREFLAALRAWWRDIPKQGEVATDVFQRLGEKMPVKRWLVRLLVRRFDVLADGHLNGMFQQ